MSIKSKTRINSIVYTCEVLHSMLLDYAEENMDDADHDIANDIGADSMDPREVNHRQEPLEPADRSYVSSGNLVNGDVEGESEWTAERRNLIQSYMSRASFVRPPIEREPG